MTTAKTFAATLALLLAGGAVTLAPSALAREKKADAPQGPKLTLGVQKALIAAQTAQKAGDNAGALAQVRAAEQAPDRTPTDNFYINNIKIGIAQATKDNAVLKEGLEGALATGLATTEQTISFTRALAGLAVQANDYQGAEKYYARLAQLQPNDAEVVSDLAKIYVKNRRVPEAMATLKQAITTVEASGKKPEEGLYGSRLQLAYDNKLTSEIDPAAQALVKAYPSSRNWENAVQIFRSGKTIDAQTDLDAYRLQRAVGALTGEGQYLDYANDAQQRGLPAEAKAVLDEGAAKHVINVGKPNYLELKRLLVPAKIASDRASLPALERQANASTSGRLSRATADGYLSHAEYAKAAALYKQALTKGGENADLVNTRLGFALAMSGDKAGAEAAFKAVSAPPRATLAQYWLIWSGQRA